MGRKRKSGANSRDRKSFVKARRAINRAKLEQRLSSRQPLGEKALKMAWGDPDELPVRNSIRMAMRRIQGLSEEEDKAYVKHYGVRSQVGECATMERLLRLGFGPRDLMKCLDKIELLCTSEGYMGSRGPLKVLREGENGDDD